MFSNILAIASLAVLSLSFNAPQVNALSTPHDLLGRTPFHTHGHALAAIRKRGEKRCKNRTLKKSSSSVAPSSSKKASSTAPAKATKTPTAPAKTDDDNDDKSNSGSSGGGGGGYSSSKKIGLAWPNGEDKAIQYYKTGKTGPVYSWSPWVPNVVKQYGFDPIPMFWCDKDIDDFKRLVVEGYASAVLGFNEPNQSGQCDISPEYGAELWKKYIDPLKNKGYKLISPATTNAPSGLTWMKKFFAACTNCHFDAVAVHYYDVSAEGLIAYVKKFHDAFNLPIWVTEFACQNFNNGPQCTKDEVFAFMETTTSFFDQTSWVEHYFYFGIMHDMQNVNYDNQLMASSGRPTDLGYKYINA